MSAKKDKISDLPLVSVRLPKAIYEQLKTISKKEHRGLGAQCTSIIEKHLAQEGCRHEQ